MQSQTAAASSLSPSLSFSISSSIAANPDAFVSRATPFHQREGGSCAPRRLLPSVRLSQLELASVFPPARILCALVNVCTFLIDDDDRHHHHTRGLQ